MYLGIGTDKFPSDFKDRFDVCVCSGTMFVHKDGLMHIVLSKLEVILLQHFVRSTGKTVILVGTRTL